MLFIFVRCESLWKPERPHVHYYWPHNIKTKLFSESFLVMASSVYLRSHHWKRECLYKSCQPVAVLFFGRRNVETKCYWSVSMLSHRCVWPILFYFTHCTVLSIRYTSDKMFVRTNRLHLIMLLFGWKDLGALLLCVNHVYTLKGYVCQICHTMYTMRSVLKVFIPCSKYPYEV